MIGQQISHAEWFHHMMIDLGEVWRAGDDATLHRLMETIHTELGEGLAHIAGRALRASANTAAGGSGFAALPPARPPYRSCDFCAAPKVGAYFPFRPFALAQPIGDGTSVFPSGDRWYVCPRCRGHVDAGEWQELRRWVGPGAAGAVLLMLNGFRMNRAGPAVEFPPGTDPEADRQDPANDDPAEQGRLDGLAWLATPAGRRYLDPNDQRAVIPYDDNAEWPYNQGFAAAAKDALWHTQHPDQPCHEGRQCMALAWLTGPNGQAATP